LHAIDVKLNFKPMRVNTLKLNPWTNAIIYKRAGQ
jgi:hypothetical protein